MPLYAFTPTGVDNKLTDLYALSNDQLATQAAAIESDTQAWLRANFTFTTPQSTFLAAIDSRALKYYGQQCAMCFLYRLNIDVVYPAPPGPGYGKWVEEKSSVKITTDNTGDVEATGSLTFTMIYKL